MPICLITVHMYNCYIQVHWLIFVATALCDGSVAISQEKMETVTSPTFQDVCLSGMCIIYCIVCNYV